VPVWKTPDPLAEKYYSISPYAYCANNPLRFIDPYGSFLIGKDGNEVSFYRNTVELPQCQLAIFNTESTFVNQQEPLSSNAKDDQKEFAKVAELTPQGSDDMCGIVNNTKTNYDLKLQNDATSLEIDKNSETGRYNALGLVKEPNGTISAKEVTITINISVLEHEVRPQSGKNENQGLTVPQAMATVFAHEIGHDSPLGRINIVKYGTHSPQSESVANEHEDVIRKQLNQ
jgi:hypothetical protein